MKQCLVLILLILSIGSCLAQDKKAIVGSNTISGNVANDTLVDGKLKMKFVLDSARINISAYDFSGHLIWQTDPWADNNIMIYRVKRPTIVYYQFQKSKWTNNQEQVWITYNNTLFGTVDKRTDKFTFMGQD